MAFASLEWIIVIVAIVLLLFGAKKIPEFARNLGKARAEFSRGQRMVEKEIRDAEKAEKEEEDREAREREDREAKRKTAMEDDAEEDEMDEEEGDEDLHKAARNLGIDPKGKTDEELKILIKHKLDEG
jgi:sec-independent protein translocase protein TatA